MIKQGLVANRHTVVHLLGKIAVARYSSYSERNYFWTWRRLAFLYFLLRAIQAWYLAMLQNRLSTGYNLDAICCIFLLTSNFDIFLRKKKWRKQWKVPVQLQYTYLNAFKFFLNGFTL